MNLLVALLAFIPAIFIVVVVHELGHYTAARICHVKVLRFSLGMGKILYRRKFRPDGTEWALSLIPVGGYVRLLDARTEDMSRLPPEAMQYEFTSKNVWQRMFIAIAGPAANFVLAIILLFSLYLYGIPHPVAKIRTVPAETVAYQSGLRGGETITSVAGKRVEHWNQVKMPFAQAVIDRQSSVDICWRTGEGQEKCHEIPVRTLEEQDLQGDFLKDLGMMANCPPAVLGELDKTGAAWHAGLRPEDKVVSVEGVPIADALALIDRIRQSPGKQLVFQVERRGRLLSLVVPVSSQMDHGLPVGKIGVRMDIAPEMVHTRYSVPAAFVESISKTVETAYLTVRSIGQMVIGDISIKNITGPVTIADYAGKTARAGWMTYLSFIVFISISIGIMNLLPIPVLDGGLLLYYAVEVIKGSSVSEKASRIGTAVGLGVLGLLIVVAMFNDIGRFFFENDCLAGYSTCTQFK